MKNKALKVIILTLILTFVLSFSVLPCFAYGDDRDSFNVVIADEALPTSLDWDVTFNLEGTSYFDDELSSSVHFKFDPVFPAIGFSDIINSRTEESTESRIYMPNAGYPESLGFSLDTIYYYNNSFSAVDVAYDWSYTSYESDFNLVGVQFQARRFYYTYSPDILTDTLSPFNFTFDGASSVTTMVYYHELGNAIDSYVVSSTDDVYFESALSPALFGYSDEDSFTIFIDRVVVIPNYDDLVLYQDGFDMSYVYDDSYCQFSRASDLNTHVTPPSDAVFADYTSWIGLAVSGFLDFQIFPGFTFGGLFMVIISFSTVMWFLKLFAGG